MTRTEMIHEIAKQACCSRRLVRKKLFELSTRAKRERLLKPLRINQALLNKSTNWLDHRELRDKYRKGNKDINPWRTANQFEVCFFFQADVLL